LDVEILRITTPLNQAYNGLFPNIIVMTAPVWAMPNTLGML
jgi:hypothetical protein